MEHPRYRSSVLRPNMALFLVFNHDHISNKKLADIGCASRHLHELLVNLLAEPQYPFRSVVPSRRGLH